MGTEYQYYCKDHDVEAAEGVQHSYLPILYEAYKFWPQIAILRATRWIEPKIMGDYDCYRFDFYEFLEVHYGHNVVIVDEYGKRPDRKEFSVIEP